VEAPTVLVVDDEPMVVEVVARYLTREGYRVVTATDGGAALERMNDSRPALVVLDLMLPVIDGLEVARRIRALGSTPIIMVTARGEEVDRIAGFDIGADDYIAKPFSPRELVARVRAVLRRSYDGAGVAPRQRLSFEGVVVDPLSRTATVSGQPVDLTAREFDLLWFLATHPGEAFSREQLLERVWEYAWAGDTGTVTVHVRRLRAKIEANPEEPRHLRTVWGVGYRWDP
jgi:two-component system response regulator ResD